MEEILVKLNEVPGIIGSMITGKDGLVITAQWKQDTEVDFMGAHLADILEMAQSMMSEKFGYGNVDMLTVEAENVVFYLKNIDDSTLMAVAAATDANMGLIRAEIVESANKLKEML